MRVPISKFLSNNLDMLCRYVINDFSLLYNDPTYNIYNPHVTKMEYVSIPYTFDYFWYKKYKNKNRILKCTHCFLYPSDNEDYPLNLKINNLGKNEINKIHQNNISNNIDIFERDLKIQLLLKQINMKRFFYYLECDEQKKLFKYLDQNQDEGFITYSTNEDTGIISISNLLPEENDELFVKLLKMDLIEDFTDDLIENNFGEDYDDFHDDYEDN